MRVDLITKADVLKVLEPIWSTKAETGRRVRQRMRTVFRWAMAHDYIEFNPAGEAIEGALPRMPKLQNHLRAMPYQDVPAAMHIIADSGASLAARSCLQFQILTAARPCEARLANWDEISLADNTWIVPATKMKMGLEHRVPLSVQALEILERVHILQDETGLLFPSPMKPGHPLSDMSATKVLRDCGLGTYTTAHGFRSSFRTWILEKTDLPWDVAESALAHRLGNSVVQAYIRSDLLEQRRELMEQWATYLNVHSGLG